MKLLAFGKRRCRGMLLAPNERLQNGAYMRSSPIIRSHEASCCSLCSQDLAHLSSWKSVAERSRFGNIRCIKKGRLLCGKRILFACWHSSFQQAVTRSLNDRNAQLQKQLENVVREANGEITLLGNKIAELERDLEFERRRVHELQDASREREKEYQRLKDQHDKVKRKALLAPDNTRAAIASGLDPHNRPQLGNPSRQPGGRVDVGAVVGGMEASGVQRTPLVTRNAPTNFGGQPAYPWTSSGARIPTRFGPHHLNPGERSFIAKSVSDQSESVNEVENMLRPPQTRRMSGPTPGSSGWGSSKPTQPRILNAAARRGFKPTR
ncbi:hypothetical protein J3A83DRAFT_2043666 [Scleroderma citrinum]